MELPELEIFVTSGIPVISVIAPLKERMTVIRQIYDFAQSQKLDLNLWNLGWGNFKKVENSSHNKLDFTDISFNQSEIFDAFDYLLNSQDNRIFILENLSSILRDKSSTLVRSKIISQIINIYYELSSNNHRFTKFLILLATDNDTIPEPLNTLIPSLYLPLPKPEEILTLIKDYLKIDTLDSISLLINAASGLTREEIISGCALARTYESRATDNQDNQRLDIKSIAHHLLNYKINCFRDLNLNFVNQTTFSNFGGFDLLKKFIQTVKLDFSPKARAANIPLPKGCLLVGPPGTGKTLSARVSAYILGFPLISVDTAAVAATGASYLKKLIQRVEASAPAVVFFDEFDKLFDSDDSGEDKNSRQILGFLLTWLQDKTSSVFVIATLNRLNALPPELTRVGRFDEIFWVGFPQAIERKEILTMHLSRFDPRYKNSNPLTDKEWRIILNKTVNCTGAELARCVEKAARDLFYQSKEMKIGLDELLIQREQIVSLYARDCDRIIAMENQAKYFSQPASSPDTSQFAPTLQSYWGNTKQ